MCVARIQVETPGNYGSLEEYFAHYQSPRHSASVPRPLTNGQHGIGTDQLTTSEVGTHTHTHTPPHPIHSLIQVVHPMGAITQYLQYFGPHIFILWKLALLKKRILIISPPPIGVVCYRG